MKIVHLNTYDIEGGAARSAYRLHKGLLAIGHESHLLSVSVQDKTLETLTAKGF